MSVWYRVFGASEKEPKPEALLEHLHHSELQIPSRFRGDDKGWFELTFSVPNASPVILERFLATEEGARDELNTWAAWLETCDYSPHYEALMERVIQAQQIYAMRKPIDHADEMLLEKLCLTLVRYLATETEGVYQIDNEGFFTPEGELLVQEY